jgi:hypothetical protein
VRHRRRGDHQHREEHEYFKAGCAHGKGGPAPAEVGPGGRIMFPRAADEARE